MFVITGATGNVGRIVAAKLLEAGQQVRAIARNRERLKELEDRGAEAMAGSMDDVAFLTNALKGSSGVLTMIPMDLNVKNVREHQDRVGEAIASALRQARPPYVVNVSSTGAQLAEGTGPIAGLHAQEERLNKLEAIHVLHLRPAYFMENLLMNIALIKHMGINGSSIRGDLTLSLIATSDVAAVAADRLLKRDFSGKTVQDLLGQRNLTHAEATAILGRAIGKPDLPYVTFSYEDAQGGMMQAGISEGVARSYNEMARALNEGIIPLVPRTRQNTTPTSIEDFASLFKAAYDKM